jgi:hypothetical protein
MGLLATLLTTSALLPQQPAPAPAVPILHPEVVLTDAVDPVPLASFGLGSGGIDGTNPPGSLRWSKEGCTTPGGVRVQCLAVGVKLSFPSGRELLLADDGTLHLRSGEKAGPFAFGAELRLGDGTAVRVVLARGQSDRLRDVVVAAGERVLQPWRRGSPDREIARDTSWGGVRLCCCGDGGEVYRAIALGPLVVLDRVLVAKERLEATPAERLVLLTAPMLGSMDQMTRQHNTPDADLRHAVRAVAATVARGDQIFPAGAALQRAEPDELRWVLRGGFELQLELTGERAPRLAMFAGRSKQPLVEWTLQGMPAAYLPNPHSDQPGAPRWHGNGTRMAAVAADLQARVELFEEGYAMRVVQRLRQ